MKPALPTVDELARAVRNVPDFPRPGIQFKDITPLLADPRLFAGAIRRLVDRHVGGEIDAVVGIDARGFILGAAVALHLGAGFVPVRKRGKLPYRTHEAQYELEYGTGAVAIHEDAFPPGSRVLLVDDLLATGGTASAAVGLARKVGATIVEAIFLIELTFLKGRDKLADLPVRSVLSY